MQPQAHEEACLTNLLDVSQFSQADKKVKEGSKNKMTLEKDWTEVVLQQARPMIKQASEAEGRACTKTLKWECAWCVQERARGASMAGGHDGDSEADVGYVAPRSRLYRALEVTDLLWVRQSHGKHLSWAAGWSDITVWMKTFAGLLPDSTLCTKTYREKTSWGLNHFHVSGSALGTRW